MELNESNLEELANWFFDEGASPPAGVLNSKIEVALECFQRLFLVAPKPRLDSNGIKSFEDILQDQFQELAAITINYNIPYPKYEFLRYLTEQGYLLHGSKYPDRKSTRLNSSH